MLAILAAAILGQAGAPCINGAMCKLMGIDYTAGLDSGTILALPDNTCISLDGTGLGKWPATGICVDGGTPTFYGNLQLSAPVTPGTSDAGTYNSTNSNVSNILNVGTFLDAGSIATAQLDAGLVKTAS